MTDYFARAVDDLRALWAETPPPYLRCMTCLGIAWLEGTRANGVKVYLCRACGSTEHVRPLSRSAA